MASEESKDIVEMTENLEKLNNLKQIGCNVGSDVADKSENSSPSRKAKRKSRSTRRRLNAMMNNTSLHFSDTDSEGELTLINTHPRTLSPGKSDQKINSKTPTISVTLEGGEANDKSENLQWHGFGDVSADTSRRDSFVENLTDVDEIYGSDPEIDAICKTGSNKSLGVQENSYQGETDYEDFSNDECDEPNPIYVAVRNDILYDLGGGTITTKEGNGPFSVEVRNQMSFDHGNDAEELTDTPDIAVMPMTDSEDIDASDEEDDQDGACGQREMLEDFDLLAASQIVMKNINKMENSLGVKDVSDNDINDSHTDVEDID